jgi:hypothetical protein
VRFGRRESGLARQRRELVADRFLCVGALLRRAFRCVRGGFGEAHGQEHRWQLLQRLVLASQQRDERLVIAADMDRSREHDRRVRSEVDALRTQVVHIEQVDGEAITAPDAIRPTSVHLWTRQRREAGEDLVAERLARGEHLALLEANVRLEEIGQVRRIVARSPNVRVVVEGARDEIGAPGAYERGQ